MLKFSMKITREEVQRSLLLARLNFGEGRNFADGAADIFRVHGKTPAPRHGEGGAARPRRGRGHRFREDRHHKPQAEKLLANAQAREKTFIKVPKIIE